MPKVSVIVPCYNMEKYIERCLDSLQKQLLEDIEIICVDDKSTDNTGEILKSRAESDPRIRIVTQARNMGVAVARNTGIKNASGEYIGFVDADDYVDIDFYQKIYNHAVKTDAEIAKGLLTVIENGHRFIPPTNEHAKRRKIRFCYDFTSAIYKKDFLDKYNLRFMEGVVLGEDITFLIKASYLCNKLAICPYGTSYYYVIRPGSANTTMDLKKINSVITIVNHMIDYANSTLDMPKEDYDFILWFLMDVLVKNIIKSKFEDRHILEQVVFDIIKKSKDKNTAMVMLCDVLVILASRASGTYIPHKKFLDIMKRHNKQAYSIYAQQPVYEKEILAGLVTTTETASFVKVKLFGTLTVYSKYKGNAPVKHNDYSVTLTEGTPKIALIVPFYNVAKYVGECMESLTKQTLKDIEIICVDDCGTDNSRQIIEQYAQNDNRIKIVKNNKNCGLSYSRNIGIKHAKAPYIMFCDSDDKLTLDACEKMLNAVHENKADIAVCSMDIIYETDTDKQKQDSYLKLQNDGVFEMNKQVQVSCNVCAPAKIYKRSIIVDKQIEFPIGLKHEDEFFYPAYCIWAKKITWVSDALYIYRRRQEPIMNSVRKAPMLNLDPSKVTIKYLQYCKKLGVWHQEKFWFWDVMFPGMFNASLHHSGPMHRKECFKYARKCIKKYFRPADFPPHIQQKIGAIQHAKI